MLIRRPSDIAPSEITPREVYLRRREFIAGAAALGLGAGLSAAFPGRRAQAAPLQAAKSPLSTTDEPPTAAQGHHQLQQLLRVRHRQGRSGQERAHAQDQALDGQGRRPRRQAGRLRPRRPHQARPARGAHLPHALRRRLVDGDPLGRLAAGRDPQARRAAGQRQVRRLRDAGAAGRDAGPARRVPAAAVALRRGPAPRRGHASAHHPGRRPLRRDAAQPERRADPAGGALEVRLQEHQVDRAHQPHREAAARPRGTCRTPSEYGFYSNVNPAVDHPRWSQATERRIGESGLFAKRRPTLPFNGYGEQVASLYAGLDLKANY